MDRFASEQAMAAEVVRWLNDQGWDVYEEVQAFSSGPRADIVAIRDALIWVIECKTTFSLDVIAQAREWSWLASAVSVAVPSGRDSRARRFAEHCCRTEGIGVIYVAPLDPEFEWARGKWGCTAPAFRRVRKSPLRNAIHNSHKRFRAGNANCEYHTPWRATCEELRRVVGDSPGLTMKEVLAKMNGHHYQGDASARSSLVRQVRIGIIKGVRLDKSKRPYRLHPSEESYDASATIRR